MCLISNTHAHTHFTGLKSINNHFYSGVIVAVCGQEPEDNRGKFFVEEYCYQELPLQPERPLLDQDK